MNRKIVFSFFIFFLFCFLPYDPIHPEDTEPPSQEKIDEIIDSILFEEIQDEEKDIQKPDVTLSQEKTVESQILIREAILFVRWRRPDLARKRLNELIEIFPESEEVFYIQGAIDFTYRRWDEAEKNLSMAISKNPKHDPALFLLGCVYSFKQDWNLAEENFKKSLNLSPYSPYYRLNLAYIYFIMDDKENAYNEISRTLKDKPNFENALVLAKHMGFTDWDDEFEGIKYISKETKLFFKKGFPNRESKIQYSMKRLYTFFPILKN